MSLKDRVAIVTGAGSRGDGIGIGRAISIVLAREGAKLVLADRHDDRAEATKALVAGEGSEAITCIGDLTDGDFCRNVVDRAVEAYGTVDILVNNAAPSKPGTVESLTDDVWNDILGAIVLGSARLARYAVPLMRAAGGGAIVNISSVTSSRGYVNVAYASAKGGIEAMTRDMAVAHGRDGIRVNSIVVGHVNTPRIGTLMGNTQDQPLRDAANPLGVEGNAWDVAWAVEYLVSDRARFVTGVALPLDGGVLATSYMSMEPIIRKERA